MFRGHYNYSVDAKGRVSIPAKLRKHISTEANDTIIMTRGLSKCIVIYPYDTWQSLENRFLELNSFDPENIKFLRIISQYAAEDVLDSQSRILIPQYLLDHAEIKKDVFILGLFDRIELWNPEIYNSYINSFDESYEEIAAKVMANGK